MSFQLLFDIVTNRRVERDWASLSYEIKYENQYMFPTLLRLTYIDLTNILTIVAIVSVIINFVIVVEVNVVVVTAASSRYRQNLKFENFPVGRITSKKCT